MPAQTPLPRATLPPTPAPSESPRLPEARPTTQMATAAPRHMYPIEVVTAATGILISHGRGAKCIGISDDGSVTLTMCGFGPTTIFSLRAVGTEEVVVRQGAATLVNDYGLLRVTTAQPPSVDAGLWFFDVLARTVRSKANGDACLELVVDAVGGLVETRLCDASNVMQQWLYNDRTGQFSHFLKAVMCLSTNVRTRGLEVQFCNAHASAQRWTIDLVHATRGASVDGDDSGEDDDGQREATKTPPPQPPTPAPDTPPVAAELPPRLTPSPAEVKTTPIPPVTVVSRATSIECKDNVH
ncbi:hypothetical protein ACHHYP_06268 [Achlya hypogyna]|uniref:Ricin B lectin domain-containing protein n=1 Tax=Achlya hypogyna TaxID=1202772 RepID=A0A1V9YUQ1_ACHHY|nr:hypothetical protein ACHHYP_06268 [Achlya hypogyna]